MVDQMPNMQPSREGKKEKKSSKSSRGSSRSGDGSKKKHHRSKKSRPSDDKKDNRPRKSDKSKKSNEKLRLDDNPVLESPFSSSPRNYSPKSRPNKLRLNDNPVLESPPPLGIQGSVPQPEAVVGDHSLISARLAPNYEDEIQAARDRAIQDVEEAHRQMAKIPVATAETVQSQPNKRKYFVFGAVAALLTGGVTAAVLLAGKDDTGGTTINNFGDEYNILRQYFVQNTLIQVVDGDVDATYKVDCVAEGADIGAISTNTTSGIERCIGLLPSSAFKSVCDLNGTFEVQLEGDYQGLVIGLGFLSDDTGVDCTGSRLVLKAATSARSENLKTLLADLTPWHPEAMAWIAEADMWEPADGDPNSDYLWRERYVMAEFYYSTDGPNWKTQVNWLSSEPVCSWYMDYTAANACPGPITGLGLEKNRLIGSIPSSIGTLVQLTSLNLWDNQLFSNIPASMGNLTNLELVWFSSNNLAGTIPDFFGQRLTMLTSLAFDTNGFEGSIPDSLTALSRLRKLWMGVNEGMAGSIPPALFDLTLLDWLSLPRMGLTGTIPSSIGNLSRLDNLRIFDNPNLSGTIPSFENLRLLETIYLYDNGFTGSIPNIGSDRLETCDLYGNCFSDPENAPSSCTVDPNCSMPPSPAASPTTSRPTPGPTPRPTMLRSDLEALLADYAPLDQQTMTWLIETDTWEPEEGDPTSDYLWLERYALGALFYATNGQQWTDSSGWLSPEPVCKWNFHSPISCNTGPITVLDLRRFGLEGSIPSVLFQLTSLMSISLYDNKLTGSIDSSIANMVQLESIFMGENRLDSSIPSSIGDLTNLRWLSLATNGLTGSLPSEIGEMTSLTRLSLDDNSLSGSIPSSVGNLRRLTALDLSDNELNGSIPSSIGNLIQLQELWLDTNQLSNSIPSSIGRLANLSYFVISGNQLESAIPSEIGLLSELSVLSLHNNDLISSIPTSISSLTKLTFLALYNNQLTSSIPASIGNLSQLEVLTLDNNNLTSSIPASISSLTKLTMLHLYVNQLTSSIPTSIGNLSQLNSLSLTENNLDGSVPVLPNSVEICHLWGNCFDLGNGNAESCIVSPNCV